MDHVHHMQQLIAYTTTNSNCIPYAASIVDPQNKLIVQVLGDEGGCPVLHAEVNAILHASKNRSSLKWNELTLYSTGEPCAMCAAACCWSNLAAVVYGVDIPFMKRVWGEGIEGHLRADEVIKTFPKSPRLIADVCQEECEQMFLSFKKPFFDFWQNKRWLLTQSAFING